MLLAFLRILICLQKTIKIKNSLDSWKPFSMHQKRFIEEFIQMKKITLTLIWRHIYKPPPTIFFDSRHLWQITWKTKFNSSSCRSSLILSDVAIIARHLHVVSFLTTSTELNFYTANVGHKAPTPPCSSINVFWLHCFAFDSNKIILDYMFRVKQPKEREREKI